MLSLKKIIKKTFAFVLIVVSFLLYVLLSATFRGACETFTTLGSRRTKGGRGRSVKALDSTDAVVSNL